MLDKWPVQEALHYAQKYGVGGAYALVRMENLEEVRSALAANLWAQGCRVQEVMGGLSSHLFQLQELWGWHRQGVLCLFEVPRRLQNVTPFACLDKNKKGLSLEVRRRTIPMVIVTESSHTIVEGTSGLNAEGPKEATKEVLARGALVLHTSQETMRSDLDATLQGLLSGSLPTNVLIP